MLAPSACESRRRAAETNDSMRKMGIKVNIGETKNADPLLRRKKKKSGPPDRCGGTSSVSFAPTALRLRRTGTEIRARYLVLGHARPVGVAETAAEGRKRSHIPLLRPDSWRRRRPRRRSPGK
ncbi:hypothetical protein EVAR_22311_1 [Eumeta japonica]|uniref:Uncharacterized protein n=1 Tax=Eumeta variegata TaxID=151549 RepID=A0A4C1UAP0_EUMVA|nr:hypothetical protein EVAR_22311_1 [Eumeta japonica]